MNKQSIKVFAQLMKAYLALNALVFIMWEMWFLFVLPFAPMEKGAMQVIPGWTTLVFFPAFLLVAISMVFNAPFLMPNPSWTMGRFAGMLVGNSVLVMFACFSVFSMLRDPAPFWRRMRHLIRSRISALTQQSYQWDDEGIASQSPTRIEKILWKDLQEVQVVFDLEEERAEIHYLLFDKSGPRIAIRGADYAHFSLKEGLQKHLPNFKDQGDLNERGQKVLWKK